MEDRYLNSKQDGKFLSLFYTLDEINELDSLYENQVRERELNKLNKTKTKEFKKNLSRKRH